MSITRREFTLMAGATLMAGTAVLSVAQAIAPQARSGNISLLLVPNNLGLRPNESGKEPGTWRAPQVLMDAGLAVAVGAAEVAALERPTYAFEAQPGTRIRNGRSLRAYSLMLSDKVGQILRAKRFPVVIGGDCSNVIGCLYGLRLAGGRGLVHIDGHSDFSTQPRITPHNTLGAAAGMDLALVSGRGEPLLTQWPKIGTPLVNDADIIQLGERNAGSPDFNRYYGEILGTEITRVTIQHALAEGVDAAARQVIVRLVERGLHGAWLHVDLDVLDQVVMPAVDSPGTPGFTYVQLATLVSALRASGRIAGVTFSNYDPERDPGARHARPLVHCISDAIRGRPFTDAA